MLQDVYKSYIESASALGNYQALSKTELANGYCDADESGNEEKRDQYFSALMLRYWFKVFKLIESSKSARLEADDFATWLSEALLLGLKYRKWRDPSNKLYMDPNGPDKVFKIGRASCRERVLFLV